jgi:hypothetical protein
MLMRILCGVLCACCVFANATEIYKTKDKNGNWIYTDQPPSADSEQVKLPPINTLPPAQNHVPISNSTRDRAAAQDEHYEVRIISPRENVTIPPGQRDLAIAVNLSRPLDPDHLLMFFINGELLEETRSSSVLVQEVYRGAHTLVVEVVDVNGRSLGKSPEVIVNVIRPSLNSPLRAGPRAN